MISRLMIANRGEIAARVARTAHAMGIDTVGVYSEPDRTGVHVDAVDLAVSLGGRTPAESYLRADAVLAVALAQGCDAVHPGYGFLSENAAFAQRVIDAGLVWVGPTPEQIALLGDKVAAKKAAIAAGVPTTPVYDASAVPPDLAMPVLVKAAAGGGGRGMRLVTDRVELDEAVRAASREAHSAFGDGTVFVEPFVRSAHHVEVQIIGDRHGNVIHLGDRECSIQRRNQKIVEESPAPCIDEATRARLHQGALALARYVGYENAGTVEYLVSAVDRSITFLEVNTRLQVEHPVTEAVTGLDLVELQLRVAAGEPLALDQADVACRGHAIEVRVVAEQPAKDWLPSTGTVRQWEFSPEVRVDSAVRAGSEVGSDYDSLLAKVIAHAPDRTRAAGLLRRTMRAAGVSGVETNVATLVGLLGEPDFLGGDTTIDYLDQHPELLRADVEDPEVRTCLLVAAVLHRALGTDGPWGFAPPAWRNLPIQGQRETLRRLGAAPDDDTVSVEYRSAGSRLFDLRLGAFPEPGPDGTSAPDERLRVHARVLAAEPPSNSEHNLAVELDGVRRVVRVAEDPDGTVHTVTAQGHASWVPVLDLGPHASGTVDSQLTAALPGTVTAVRVRAGDTVDEGQVLLLMEAMKMEHSVTAPRSAVVAQVPVSLGDRVSDGDVLVRLEDDSAR